MFGILQLLNKNLRRLISLRPYCMGSHSTHFSYVEAHCPTSSQLPHHLSLRLVLGWIPIHHQPKDGHKHWLPNGMIHHFSCPDFGWLREQIVCLHIVKMVSWDQMFPLHIEPMTLMGWYCHYLQLMRKFHSHLLSMSQH